MTASRQAFGAPSQRVAGRSRATRKGSHGTAPRPARGARARLPAAPGIAPSPREVEAGPRGSRPTLRVHTLRDLPTGRQSVGGGARRPKPQARATLSRRASPDRRHRRSPRRVQRKGREGCPRVEPCAKRTVEGVGRPAFGGTGGVQTPEGPAIPSRVGKATVIPPAARGGFVSPVGSPANRRAYGRSTALYRA